MFVTTVDLLTRPENLVINQIQTTFRTRRCRLKLLIMLSFRSCRSTDGFCAQYDVENHAGYCLYGMAHVRGWALAPTLYLQTVNEKYYTKIEITRNYFDFSFTEVLKIHSAGFQPNPLSQDADYDPVLLFVPTMEAGKLLLQEFSEILKRLHDAAHPVPLI